MEQPPKRPQDCGVLSIGCCVTGTVPCVDVQCVPSNLFCVLNFNVYYLLCFPAFNFHAFFLFLKTWSAFHEGVYDII